MPQITPNQELQLNRSYLEKEENHKYNWGKRWHWLIYENIKTKKLIEQVFIENKNIFIRKDDPYYNTKLNVHILDKLQKNDLIDKDKNVDKNIDKDIDKDTDKDTNKKKTHLKYLTETTNEEYGHLGWEPIEPVDRTLQRRPYFSTRTSY